MEAGHRAVSHGGEVSGFVSESIVFPDEKVSVVALTNQDASSAADDIAHGIVPLLFEQNDPATPEKLEQAKKIFEGLQHSKIDRSLSATTQTPILVSRRCRTLRLDCRS